jgi:GNAT superfamily N-acetyltransferase
VEIAMIAGANYARPELSVLPSGRSLSIRFVTPLDGPALQAYFESLSPRTRYDRFAGASAGLPPQELARTLRLGDDGRFALVAETAVEGRASMVAEARYRFDARAASFEIGLSVHDAWQRQGIGTALLMDLERRALAAGAREMFGETLRTNAAMQALARRQGFRCDLAPGDWRMLRIIKPLEDSSFEDKWLDEGAVAPSSPGQARRPVAIT